jgi:hypothetical protein
MFIRSFVAIYKKEFSPQGTNNSSMYCVKKLFRSNKHMICKKQSPRLSPPLFSTINLLKKPEIEIPYLVLENFRKDQVDFKTADLPWIKHPPTYGLANDRVYSKQYMIRLCPITINKKAC